MQRSMSLPDDLVREILLKLPPSVKSAMRLSCVCKLWRNFIFKDPLFGDKLIEDAFMVFYLSQEDRKHQIRTHNFQTFGAVKFPGLIAGSCNGIVCLREGLSNVYLYNPITREHRKLPPPDFYPRMPQQSGGFGFGFDKSSNDYKVINITNRCQAEVYKLSTNCWSKLDADLRPFFRYVISCSECVYVNGYCHWLLYTSTKYEKIIRFDLRTETFDMVDVTMQTPYLFQLCVLDNSVAVVSHSWGKYTVYAMSEYGNKDSWIMKFDINTGARLSWNGSYWVEGAHLFQLNPNGELMLINQEKGGDNTYKPNNYEKGHFVVFKPSFVSLGSGCFIHI